MGNMTTCTGAINDHLSSKEIKFNLLESNMPLIKGNKNKKLKSNSQIYSIVKEEENKDDFRIFKFEKTKKNQIYQIPRSNNRKNFFKMKKEERKENITNNDIDYNEKMKRCVSGLKQIDKNEDDCDIIECEDEFECENILDLIKNVDIPNKKRSNYFNVKNNILKGNKKNKSNRYDKENSNEKEKEMISNNNNVLLNDSYINKDLNMELSVSKNKINGSEIQCSSIFENLNKEEKSIEKSASFKNSNEDSIKMNNKNNNNKKDKAIDNFDNMDEIKINCYDNRDKSFNLNNNNIDLNKKDEGNHSYFNNKKEKENIKNNNLKDKIDINKSENKSNIIRNNQNNEFQNCKIDNNINININNNLSNINNINTINNISSINNNSELNNNNYIDVSSNTTYFLSVEKSHRRPITSLIDKNALYLKKNIYDNNININKMNYDFRNSVGINRFKWKLMPKQKYNTQICKSFNNGNQSFSINEENQNHKISQLTTIMKENKNTNYNSKIESKNDNISFEENNNIVFSEFKKQKEEQDKKIKLLQDKIKNLYNIIKEEKNKEIKNDEKISKLEEIMVRGKRRNSARKEEKIKFYKDENIQYKKALNDIKFVESQKDYRIKKLEEELENLKKNNKINKQLLAQKNNQIKNLKASKSKQDELIKQYEILSDINFKNNSTKGTTKINYFEDKENYYNNLAHKTSVSVNLKKNNSCGKMTFQKNQTFKKLNKSISLKNEINKPNNNNFNNNKDKKFKKALNKGNNKNKKTSNLKKQINTKDISNLKEISNLEQEGFQKENSDGYIKTNITSKNKSKKQILNININSINNRLSFNERNINYNNYCNSLCNKSKNKYSNKISLNRIKMYKYNKLQNLPTITNKVSNKFIISNKANVKYKKSINSKNYSSKKNFSFKKSKKISNNYEKDLKEMYLKAGTSLKEEENDNKKALFLNNINNNNDMKFYPSNNILYRNNNNKTNITNSNNNTAMTNNITNLSMSPIIISRFQNLDNLSMDDKLNLSGNINNYLSNISNYFKSNINGDKEKDKDQTNKIYRKLWDEGFLRYEEMCKSKYSNKKENESNYNELSKNCLKLNFGMANELIEINIDQNDFMMDVKNKFLNNFFEKKIYGDNEKKYITENILFLNKGGIIDIYKKVNENNINNNEIIIPVLKDVT